MANDSDIFGATSGGVKDADIFGDLKTAEVRAQSVAKPPMESSSTLAANAGFAKFGAGAIGLPMDALQGAYNLFKSGIGVAQHKLLGTEPPALTSNLPGTSASIEGVLRSTGMPGLSPDNPRPDSRIGTAAYDFTSRGGVIPGGALPAVGSMIAEKIGGPEWAGVGALAPQAGVTAYNASRAPALAAEESRNAVRDATLRAGREAGLVTSPSATGGGPVTNLLESVGGKAAVGQQAALKNQEIVTALARKEAGLPENSAVSVEALESRRNVLSAPYREVAALNQDAAASLEKLKETRNDATRYYKEYDATLRVAALKKAEKLRAEATALEGHLEDVARQHNRPELIDELRAARTAIAKTHDVERALNVGTGDVSAPILGRMVDKGKPLSGGLEVAGRFQQAFPAYMREGASVPPPNVSALNPLLAGGLGYGGYSAMGWPGAALAALPFLRAPLRYGILSNKYQDAMMPSYGPAVTPAPSPQLLYQLGILSGQR